MTGHTELSKYGHSLRNNNNVNNASRLQYSAGRYNNCTNQNTHK